MKRRVFLTLPAVALGGCAAATPTPGAGLADLLGASSGGRSTGDKQNAVMSDSMRRGPGDGFGREATGVYIGTGSRLALPAVGGATWRRDVRLIVVLPDTRWRSGLPANGLDIDLAADTKQFSGRWGQWKTVGTTLIATRDNDRIDLTDGSWRKLAAIDGMLCDGQFVREDSIGQWGAAAEPALILRADGTFDDRSGLTRMVGSLGNFEINTRGLSQAAETALLGPGSGRYTFKNYTLTLTYEDGRVRRLNVYVPPDDSVKSPRRLIVGDYVLVNRQRR